jgi:hypothetical protein
MILIYAGFIVIVINYLVVVTIVMIIIVLLISRVNLRCSLAFHSMVFQLDHYLPRHLITRPPPVVLL